MLQVIVSLFLALGVSFITCICMSGRPVIIVSVLISKYPVQEFPPLRKPESFDKDQFLQYKQQYIKHMGGEF
jgi:hypothetical protein